jgi:hypothetical protein
MKEKVKSFYEKIGIILSDFNDIEAELEFFISNYFIIHETSKTIFFKKEIISKYNFETKRKLFLKICEKEKFDQKIINDINKKIKENQLIRNKIAHWKSKTNLNKELYFEKYDKQGDISILKLDKDVTRKFKKNKLLIIENIKKFYYKYYKEGTFETRSLIDFKNDQWHFIYKELKIFFSERERFPYLSSSDKTESDLSKWCSLQRKAYIEKELTNKQINSLEKLTFWFWEIDDIWTNKYVFLKNFIIENNEYPQALNDKNPSFHVSKEEHKLASWIRVQRSLYLKKQLSKERIRLLDKLPDWNWSREEKWEKSFEDLKVFVRINSRFPNSRYKGENENILFVWCTNQRRAFNGDKNYEMTDERKNKLESLLGWDWGYKRNTPKNWDETFNKLKLFIKTCNKFPTSKKIKNEEKYLTSWIENQKYLKRRNKLSPEKIQKLDTLNNWDWGSKEITQSFTGTEKWASSFNKMKTFIEKNKRYPNRKKINNDDQYLVNWYERQRYNYKNNKLNDNQINKLNSLPNWNW